MDGISNKFPKFSGEKELADAYEKGFKSVKHNKVSLKCTPSLRAVKMCRKRKKECINEERELSMCQIAETLPKEHSKLVECSKEKSLEECGIEDVRARSERELREGSELDGREKEVRREVIGRDEKERMEIFARVGCESESDDFFKCVSTHANDYSENCSSHLKNVLFCSGKIEARILKDLFIQRI